MIAVDTNVLLYRFDETEPVKQSIAKSVILRLSRGGETVLLWQVAGELLSQLTYWQNQRILESHFVDSSFLTIRKLFPLLLPSESSLDQAILLKRKYSLQHWDSMLLGACLDVGISVLYTEDMGAPRRIENLELVNPFQA